jgi:ABC-2 type transport system permease protein
VVIFLLSIALGVKLDWNPLRLVGVLVVVVLAASAFCAFSLVIAFIVKTRERFMGIGQLLTMPFFFASSAIYPISIMPRPLQVIAHGNPLTYEVDALRSLMLRGGTSTYGLGMDFGVLVFATALLVTIAAQLYPRAAT